MSAPARAVGRLALAACGALFLWLAIGAQVWGSGVIGLSETVIRSVERPRATRLEHEKGEVLIHRTDMGSDSDVPAFDVTGFTAPTVLLLTLVWGTGRLVPRHGWWRGATALAVLFVAQTVHLVCAIETLYATQLGEWSLANYPRWQRELFATGRSAFDLGLAWGLPVALWIAFYGLPEIRGGERPRTARKKKGRG